MRRREFITLLGGATAWPLAARAQQSGMPVVGFINSASAQSYKRQLAAFLQGLSEAGYVDGRNVTIEYRWADGRSDRLPAMVADLVRRQVAVIAATSSPAALAAKASTTTFRSFSKRGRSYTARLGDNLNRPGGNITGITQLSQEVTPKRLQLLHELLPMATSIALLVNPGSLRRRDPVEGAAVGRPQTWAGASRPQRQQRKRLGWCFCRGDQNASRRARDWWRPILHEPERTARRACAPLCGACGLLVPRVRRGRRSIELRSGHH